MKRAFGKFVVASTAALVLVGLAMAPIAEAADRGARGDRGGAHAGNRGGGAAQKREVSKSRENTRVNNRRADVRSNNVRNTSVNNVNVNRNVNVDVDHHHHGGWDNDYHPVATAAAVGATVAVTAAVVGSIVNSVPSNCVPVNYGGMVYQQCGSTWYQPQGTQYIVVNPPY